MSERLHQLEGRNAQQGRTISHLRITIDDQERQLAEARREIERLRAGQSVAPERSRDAVETLTEARHLFSLAGELRAALTPFIGGE